MEQSPAASQPVVQPSLAQPPHLWSMPVSSVAASSGFLSPYEQVPSRLLQATVPPHPPPPAPAQFHIPSGNRFDNLSQEQPATPLFHGTSSSHPFMSTGFLSGAPQDEQQQQAQAMRFALPPHQLQQQPTQQQQLQPHHGLATANYPSAS